MRKTVGRFQQVPPYFDVDLIFRDASMNVASLMLRR
jgi:hypothetical protein